MAKPFNSRLALTLACVIVPIGASLAMQCMTCPNRPECLEYFGVWDPEVICGANDSNVGCTNAWEQKWLCNNAPGLPAAWGYKTRSQFYAGGACIMGQPCL